ncbi:acetolactate decarboxylase [Priestia koreensis]|uniref:acetolactate decarboxylase n=1 Tax=Priestia koreensis TaxID=284581 RepID=UPI00204172C0|nr:acetolactate decarboxylase [Priestia koreensis]MCM3004032.1 acetolactate decarboxylase [Priestia koreensis]
MTKENQKTIYQTSTMIALLDGVFDGVVTYKDLAKQGDFGLGTFNKLDGEMIAIDGEFYQITHGKAIPVEESAKTPFAIMTTFQEEVSYKIEEEMSLEQLEEWLNKRLQSKNIFYAIRIDGTFREVKTRTVAKQEKPYPSMVEAAENQPTFTSTNVTGTIAGFFTPDYATGIGVPGYHLHFIDEARKEGGHVQDLTIENITIKICQKTKLDLTLLETNEFLEADLESHSVEEEIATAE